MPKHSQYLVLKSNHEFMFRLFRLRGHILATLKRSLAKQHGPWVICKDNLDTKERLYSCDRRNVGPGFYPTLTEVKEFKSARDAEFFADPKWSVMKQPGWEFKVVSRIELPW